MSSSVAFATEVSRIAKCNAPRSQAKKTPARISSFDCAGLPGPPPRSDASTQAQSGGTASAMRQNALAVGLVSESRTKIGAKAIAAAPKSSAAIARGLRDKK